MIISGSLVPGIDPGAFGLPVGTALRYERPAIALRSLLPSYAVLDSDPAVWKGPDSWALPGWSQLWFVLTDGTVTVRTRKRKPAPLCSAVLYGGTSCAMPVTSQGGVTVVVDLSPLGWARWFDRPANELRDQIMPLDRFWPADRISDLIARLNASDRGLGVQGVLDDFFLAELPSAHRDEPALSRIVALLSEGDGLAAGEAAARIECSHSTLLRLTNRHFGYSWKLLTRRTRFLRVLTTMMMADEVLDHAIIPRGYHDVPHFLRDAQEFLTLTPRRFLALPMPYLRAVLRARTITLGAPLPMLDLPSTVSG